MLRWLAVLVLAGIILLPLAARGQDRVADPSALPEAFSNAWARGDGQALGAIMSEDVDFVTVGGAWLHGREDFSLYHERLLQGRFSGSVIEPLEVRIRSIRPDLVFVRWSWRMTGDRNADGSARPPRFGLMSMLAEKKGDGWEVVGAQNTNAGPGTAPEIEGLEFPIRLPPNRD